MYNTFRIIDDKGWVDKIRSFLFVRYGKEGCATGEKNGKIEERARKIAAPLIEERGYTLWDVRYEKEGAMWYLRILFDKDGGIDSDECEEISGPLNELMDRQDFIGSVDILEIGSPGLTRRLRRPEHFRACIGSRIRVTLRDEKGKEISVSGTLSDYNEERGEFTLENEGEEPRVYAVSDCVKINSDF